jgi:hypothetical protein
VPTAVWYGEERRIKLGWPTLRWLRLPEVRRLIGPDDVAA